LSNSKEENLHAGLPCKNISANLVGKNNKKKMTTRRILILSTKLKLRLRKLVSILKSLKLFNTEIKEDDSIFRVLILVKPKPKLNFTTIENKTFCKNEK